jgi:hypothetical protein
MLEKSAMRMFRILCITILFFSLKLFITPLLAENKKEVELPKELTEFLIKTKKKMNDGLTLTLGSNFKTNSTHYKENEDSNSNNDMKDEVNTTINFGLEGWMGFCPNEVTFELSLEYDFREGKVKENIHKINISYERHINKTVELFTFLQSIKNSYMKVKQLLEFGVGIKLEFEPKKLVDEESKHLRDIANKYLGNTNHSKNKRKSKKVKGIPLIIKNLDTKIKTEDQKNVKKVLRKIKHLDKKPKSPKKDRIVSSKKDKAKKQRPQKPIDRLKLKNELKKVKRKIKWSKIALSKRYAKWNLGLSFALVQENERSFISVNYKPTTDNITERKTEDVYLNTVQRCRLVFRPSYYYRFGSKWTFKTYYFSQIPLFKWNINENPGDHAVLAFKYRHRLETKLEFELSDDISWAKKVTLKLVVKIFFNKNPHYITLGSELIPQKDGCEVIESSLIAPNRHIYTSITLDIKL